MPHLVPPRALHLRVFNQSTARGKTFHDISCFKINKLHTKHWQNRLHRQHISEDLTRARLWETNCTIPTERELDSATCSISLHHAVCSVPPFKDFKCMNPWSKHHSKPWDPNRITSVLGGSSLGVADSVEALELASVGSQRDRRLEAVSTPLLQGTTSHFKRRRKCGAVSLFSSRALSTQHYANGIQQSKQKCRSRKLNT